MDENNIIPFPNEKTLEQLVQETLEVIGPYQELVDHIMKARDNYFELMKKHAINKLREELEYYESLWNEAREICRKNGLRYSGQTEESSKEPG
jgi:hypothetical protein